MRVSQLQIWNKQWQVIGCLGRKWECLLVSNFTRVGAGMQFWGLGHHLWFVLWSNLNLTILFWLTNLLSHRHDETRRSSRRGDVTTILYYGWNGGVLWHWWRVESSYCRINPKVDVVMNVCVCCVVICYFTGILMYLHRSTGVKLESK